VSRSSNDESRPQSICRTPVRGARVAGVLAAALALGGTASGVAQASASPSPTPLLSVSTTETPASGAVRLDDAIAEATRCSVSATISLPYRDSTATTGPYADTPASSVLCLDSTGTATVTLPADTTTGGTAATDTLTFTAGSIAGTSRATRTLSLVVPAPPVSITASPQSLDVTGGMVSLRSRAAGASSCTVSSAGLRFNQLVSCTDGSAWALVPPNATSSAETYTFVLTADGPSGTSSTASTTVTVAARPAHRQQDPWSWLLAGWG